jgi:hypothetical protein
MGLISHADAKIAAAVLSLAILLLRNGPESVTGAVRSLLTPEAVSQVGQRAGDSAMATAAELVGMLSAV